MKLLFATIVALILAFASSVGEAGGGPENLLLVVNANSDSSKTIANHYINLRQIPAVNVVYLNWKAVQGTITASVFRDQILLPVLLAAQTRQLTPQIDYIIYSSDFPWRIDLHDVYPGETFPPGFYPLASLTGTTYLAPLLLAKNPAIVLPDINSYLPDPSPLNLQQCQNLASVQSRAFRSRYSWDRNGNKTAGAQGGQSYFLSTMLGVVGGRGNTVDEVLNYLRRSAMADGTPPKGDIYFMWNKDVRSYTRDKCFTAVAAQINATGAHAVVKQGALPVGAKNVAGMMVGAAKFNLAKDGVKILPGAICDHLTSEGGYFIPGGNQTTLSDFLRAGAAGASGTVAEPLALQAKFPLASIQLHYVRGCSLAEAFYQSVGGPYQLLIVGDPLCQPWATFPKIAVSGVKNGEKVKGTLSLNASSTLPIGAYEIYVDGRLLARGADAALPPLDTTNLSDGYHELRVVGIRSDRIETQGRAIIPVVVNNHDAAVEINVGPSTRIPLSAKFKIDVRQSGATSITIRQNNRDLGNVKGESGELEVLATSLGRGPTTLQAITQGKAAAASAPVQVVVE